MPMLERTDGNIHYELCDIVPPWVEPRETILFLHGLAIDSDIWVTWLPVPWRTATGLSAWICAASAAHSFPQRAKPGPSTRWPATFETCSPRLARSGFISSANRRAARSASNLRRTVRSAC